MRNIHSLQIFTAWSYKPPEHSLLGSLFQCCLKKEAKNTGPYFLNSPRICLQREPFINNHYIWVYFVIQYTLSSLRKVELIIFTFLKGSIGWWNSPDLLALIGCIKSLWYCISIVFIAARVSYCHIKQRRREPQSNGARAGEGVGFWKFADENWSEDMKSAIELVVHFFSVF